MVEHVRRDVTENYMPGRTDQLRCGEGDQTVASPDIKQ